VDFLTKKTGWPHFHKVMATSAAEATGRDSTPMERSEPPPPVPAFAALCAGHFDFVWKCARGLGARPDEIDDVVQDVFLVVQRRHAELRDHQLARSWIYSITRRVVSTHRRRRRARHSGTEPDVDSLLSPDESPHAVAEHNWEVRLLSALLDAMDERKREVFVLSEILELSGREIAEIIGVPMNTVYSRLRAAREEFDAAAQRQRKMLERRRAR
jgi:RNA polymerase sigma-70 factor (ECF subfamily)